MSDKVDKTSDDRYQEFICITKRVIGEASYIIHERDLIKGVRMTAVNYKTGEILAEKNIK